MSSLIPLSQASCAGFQFTSCATLSHLADSGLHSQVWLLPVRRSASPFGSAVAMGYCPSIAPGGYGNVRQPHSGCHSRMVVIFGGSYRTLAFQSCGCGSTHIPPSSNSNNHASFSGTGAAGSSLHERVTGSQRSSRRPSRADCVTAVQASELERSGPFSSPSDSSASVFSVQRGVLRV